MCGQTDGAIVHTEPMGPLSSPLTGRFSEDLPVHIVRCASCDFMYSNPRPTTDVLDERYQHMSNMEYNLAGQQTRVRMYRHLLRKLNRRHKGRGKLLDVGCFSGTLLSVAAETGWEPWGVEINKTTATYARDELGFEVKICDLAEAKFPDEFFDAVTMTDVAEHVIDPKSTFREMFRVTKRGGVLLLTVPNGAMQLPKEHLRKRLGRGTGMITGGLGHINHFSPATMRAALESVGYRRVRIGCMIPGLETSANVDLAKRMYTHVARFLRTTTRIHIGHELLVIAVKP